MHLMLAVTRDEILKKIEDGTRIDAGPFFVPGSFPGFRNGTKGTLSLSASGGPKMKPRASKPAIRSNQRLAQP